MMFITYCLKNFIKGKLHSSFVEKSPFFRGLRFYSSVQEGKKGLFQVYKECKNLFQYWGNVWPSSYFRFGMFMKGWKDYKKMQSFIPSEAYARYAVGNDARYNLLIDDKIIFHDLMSFYGLPVPHRYFVFRDDTFRRGGVFLSDTEVDNLLENISDNCIFVKYFTGGAASGISVLHKNTTPTNESGWYDKDENKITASVIRKQFAGKSIIFEKQIIQHPVLAKFNPSTVNTIRALTYNNKVVSMVVRFGRAGNFVDNTAKGGIAVALDMENGELSAWGMREYELEHYYEHPDSHIPFKETKIEMWLSAKELVEQTLRILPYYKSVGFDIALTPEGPVVVEINTGAGVYLSQMGMEYGIADVFKE